MWGQRPSTDDGLRVEEIDGGIAELEPYFLGRLRRLSALRHASRRLPRTDQRLVDHALYSTYWDCVQLGLRGAAREALELPRETAIAS